MSLVFSLQGRDSEPDAASPCALQKALSLADAAALRAAVACALGSTSLCTLHW